MKREDFDHFTNEFNHFKGLLKACFIVREYQRCDEANNLENCAVTKEEYHKALSLVLAFAHNNAQNVFEVEQWHCKDDCNRHYNKYGFCPGEFQINNDKPNLCKWYSGKEYRIEKRTR